MPRPRRLQVQLHAGVRMMGRFAFWLEAHTGQSIAGIVIACAAIAAAADMWRFALILLSIAVYALGAAYDIDNPPER